MSVNPIESGVGGLWYTPQTTLGTIEPDDADTMIRLRKVGDDGFKSAKTLASEEYVDGQAFGSPAMYVDAVGGAVGTATFQAQVETAGLMFAQMVGVDVVTGSGDPYTHTITTSNANGALGTWYQATGVDVGPWQDSYFDSMISKLALNCGQDQKTMHLAADVVAIVAGSAYDTQPVAADSGTDPFRWDQVTGSIKMDSTVYTEIDGQTLELDRKLDVHRGDSVAPAAIFGTKGTIMQTFNAIVTDATLPVMRTALWGTTTPADGLAVTQAVVYKSFETTYTATVNHTLKITTPKVAIHPDDFAVFPQAEGGKIAVVFTGECLKSGGTPALTIVAKTAQADAFV